MDNQGQKDLMAYEVPPAPTDTRESQEIRDIQLKGTEEKMVGFHNANMHLIYLIDI